MTGWLPIETAPKVARKPMLVWVDGCGPAIVAWCPDDYTEPVWMNWMEGQEYGLPMRYDVTHWMPIPIKEVDMPYADGSGTFKVWDIDLPKEVTATGSGTVWRSGPIRRV